MKAIITIEPEAKKYFDEKVNSLLDDLMPLQIEPQSKPLRGSTAHRPVITVRERDLIQFKDQYYVDELGRFCGFKIHEGDIAEFLPKDAAQKLERIVDRVYRISTLKPYCSKIYIRDHLVGWMRRIRLEKTADKSWITDLMSHLHNDVCDQTILVPLEGIQIAIPFKLGNVTFKYFTKSMLDSMLKNIKDDTLDMEIFCENFKKKYQGRVYTRFQCKAESLHAQTLASIHTDNALEILKFFSQAALEIRAQCFLGRKGQVNPSQWNYFVEQSGGNFRVLEDTEIYRYDYVIDEEFFRFWKPEIHIIAQMLIKNKITDLERSCIEAISHYAHGVTSREPQDRLLHALVAVESLLLRDQNEPVQSHLGYRIAILTASNLEERKKAKRDFIKGYNLRSKFVHHGAKPDDIEMANRVLILCWSAIIEIIKITKRVNSK